MVELIACVCVCERERDVTYARMHAHTTVHLCIEETPLWIYGTRDIDIFIYIGVKEVPSGGGRVRGKWRGEQ